jgi:hypothetical protein
MNNIAVVLVTENLNVSISNYVPNPAIFIGLLQSEGQNARAGLPALPSPMGVWELPDGAGGAVGINISGMSGLLSGPSDRCLSANRERAEMVVRGIFSTQSRWQTLNTWASYTEAVLKIHIGGLQHIPGVHADDVGFFAR